MTIVFANQILILSRASISNTSDSCISTQIGAFNLKRQIFTKGMTLAKFVLESTPPLSSPLSIPSTSSYQPI